MPLTPAERQKRYREKLKKENPDKYAAYKKKMAVKALLYYREKVYTDVEKEKRRQQVQQRKVSNEKPTSTTKKKIPLTPAERQKRYREKLKKENPIKYNEYKKKMAAKALLYYRVKINQYRDEGKDERRKQWKDANKNVTSPANKMPFTTDGGPKKYKEKLEKRNPNKLEETKKKDARNYRCYREKTHQYTEDKTEKSRQQCNISKISSAEKKIQEKRIIKKKNMEIAKCNKEIAHIPQTTLNEVKKPLTPAERQRRYREKIKRENPDKYVEIKNKAAASAKRYYREKVSCNKDTSLKKQWNDVRGNILSPGEKMKRYRERLKRENPAKYSDYMKKTAESAKRYYREKAMLYTEEEREERRQKWKEARIYKEEQNKRQKQKRDEMQMNEEESLSEDDVHPDLLESLMTPPWHPDSQSVSDNSQDPLRKLTEHCRFCGEDSKDYLVISSNMPYLAGNVITLALNDTTIQLDFNDGLPNTVCTHCNIKLQEYCDFIKTVKTAQNMLKRKIKSETEDVGEADVFIKTEAPEEEMNSISISDTVFVKNTVSYKRKGDVTKQKAKFAKNVMVESENEMIFDMKEEVDYDEQIECSVLSNADSETFSVNDMVECENEMLTDIKQEIVNDDEHIECSRISESGSETLSIPDELKYTFMSEIDETLVIRKGRTGNDTTVNATRKERTGSDTTVNATRKEGTRSVITVNATRTGSATTVNATRTGSATTVNATSTGSATTANATRIGSATTVNATGIGSATTVNATRNERTGNVITVSATRTGSIITVSATRAGSAATVNSTRTGSATTVNATRIGSVTTVNATRIGSATTVNATRAGSATTVNATRIGSATTVNATRAGSIITVSATRTGSAATVNTTRIGSATTVNATRLGSATTVNATRIGSATTVNATRIGSATTVNATRIGSATTVNATRIGSATTVNATRIGSATTVNATRIGSATTVNATRIGSATTVNATRIGSATTVNATRIGSATTVNATRIGSATTVNATSALSPQLVAGIICLAQRSATGGP